MKNVLVIGASGFIGKHVCFALIQAGYNVYASRYQSQPDSLGTASKITWITLDVTAPVDWQQHFHDYNIDAIIYLACTLLPHASNENPVLDIQSNLLPVIRLLEAVKSNNTIKIIFASSGGTIYGVSSGRPISESQETKPRCSYGIVKLAVENYLALYRDLFGVNAICLRIGNPYGVGQEGGRPQGAIGVFSQKLLSNQTISIWGDGTIVRDYIAVTDVASAFLAALRYSGDKSIFNIGSGVGTSLNELLGMIFNSIGRSVAVQYFPSREFDVQTNILSIELAKKELGWMPSQSLDDGIKSFLNIMLGHAHEF